MRSKTKVNWHPRWVWGKFTIYSFNLIINYFIDKKKPGIRSILTKQILTCQHFVKKTSNGYSMMRHQNLESKNCRYRKKDWIRIKLIHLSKYLNMITREIWRQREKYSLNLVSLSKIAQNNCGNKCN